MLSRTISLFVIFLSPIYGKQLHDFMKGKEKESMFGLKHYRVNTANYEDIPLITKCTRSQKSNEIECPRSTPEFEKNSVYINTFGQNFEQYMEEDNNILFGSRTPIITPYIGFDGKIKYYKRIYDVIPSLKMEASHDKKKRAALMPHENKNPKVNKSTLTPLEDEQPIVLGRKIRALKSQPSKPNISPSNYREFTVYPKILIVLDHATYLLNNKDIAKCIQHTHAYWNVVDLRFREMDKPKVRLHIAGIIIATKPKVLPYMEGKKSSPTSRYHEKALDEVQHFFEKENVTFIDYDIVIGISPLKVVDGGNWWRPIFNYWLTNSKLDDSIHGLANMASICKFPREAMALVRDGGNLFNARVAAHEIGHILSLDHDPENLPINHPDYKSDWKHGFIMSYLRGNKNQMLWSDASIRGMQEYLQKHENNHCLLYKPRVGIPYRKLLPGKFVDRNEQCKILVVTTSYSSKNIRFLSDCLNCYCFAPDNGTYLRIQVPVAEGSPCGRKNICIEGECVHDCDPYVYQNLLKEEGPKK